MPTSTMKFLAEYPALGNEDFNPELWINHHLEEAQRDGLIFDYKFVYVFSGIFTDLILFEFSTSVMIEENEKSTWMSQSKSVVKQGKKKANQIVNDKDARILSFQLFH